MPLIKARTRGKQFVRHVTRFDRETNETVYAYAHFIGEPPEYVLAQLVDTLGAKDKEFLAWRADHPESFVPRRVARRPRAVRRISHDGTGSMAGRAPAGGVAGHAPA